MSDSSYVGDYFYVNEESIKHRHELERQKGNPFVTGSRVWPAPASYSSHTAA